jgi:hypothetical protein
MFDKHIQAMAEANAATMLYLQEIHTRLWTRSQYSRKYMCMYLASNISPVGGDRWENGKGNKGYKGSLMQVFKRYKDTNIILFHSK